MDLRKRAAEAKEVGEEATYEQLDGLQNHLKILANSIYGFFEEQNIEERVRAVQHAVYSLRGREPKNRWLRTIERPGKYFHPLLGTCITSAAHLFLAIAEHLADKENIEWMLTDTDSMAFARPLTMVEETFRRKVQHIRDWFAPLNPYAGMAANDLFKYEPINKDPNSGGWRELYGLAIAPKSYCLFTLDEANNPIIQEGKQHGLGHLLPPYTRAKDKEKRCIRSTKLRCWQRDVWELVVRAHLEKHLNRVDYLKLEGFNNPAAHRFTVSTIRTEKDCEPYNKVKPYRDRIRPGGFLLSFPAKNRARLKSEDAKRGLTRNSYEPISPYAPYDRDPRKAAENAFDRRSGRAVGIDELETYAESLRYFHIRPQDKYDGSNFLEAGTTWRKHVIPLWIDIVGKETRRFSTEDPYVFESEFRPTDYGSIPAVTFLRWAAEVLGHRDLARICRVSVSHATALLAGERSCTPEVLLELRDATLAKIEQGRQDRQIIERIVAHCRRVGSLRKGAASLGVDAGDLSRTIKGTKRISNALRRRFQ